MADMEVLVRGRAELNPSISKQIATFERQIKALQQQEDELKAAILNAMEYRGIISLETDDLKISYVAATDRESFDKKRFRADHPELHDEYVTMTPVRSSIRIKVK